MQFSSRRAFLMGRRSSKSPWAAFCQGLQRRVAGSFLDYGLSDGVGSARLTPLNAADLHHARALCAEHGVVLALDGINQAASQSHQSVLWVELGSHLTQCQRLPNDASKWFVQPGCLLGDLEAAGLKEFAGLPGYLTVAAWLADRSLQAWESGATHRSGVAHACVLLADGTQATLGPFGEHNRQPLDGLALQTLVSGLFTLTGSTEAQACRQEPYWAARYRLDALMPQPGHIVNLSHLLLGHGGDLGWLEWVVLDETALSEAAAADPMGFSLGRQAPHDVLWAQAIELDVRVKTLFDPNDVFPHPGQDL